MGRLSSSTKEHLSAFLATSPLSPHDIEHGLWMGNFANGAASTPVRGRASEARLRGPMRHGGARKTRTFPFSPLSIQCISARRRNVACEVRGTCIPSVVGIVSVLLRLCQPIDLCLHALFSRVHEPTRIGMQVPHPC